MASFFRSSQNTFDTFSHLLDNLFLEPVYQYSRCVDLMQHNVNRKYISKRIGAVLGL
jgi:hypothetical protein